jgi:hypothetical protein
MIEDTDEPYYYETELEDDKWVILELRRHVEDLTLRLSEAIGKIASLKKDLVDASAHRTALTAFGEGREAIYPRIKEEITWTNEHEFYTLPVKIYHSESRINRIRVLSASMTEDKGIMRKATADTEPIIRDIVLYHLVSQLCKEGAIKTHKQEGRTETVFTLSIAVSAGSERV